MSSLLLSLALVTFAGVLIGSFLHTRGIRSVGSLRDKSTSSCPSLRVSIIIVARNEEKYIRQGVLSALNSTYESKEVIVVDDRSDDNTPRILKELEKDFPSLRILSVNTLPADWLGKNHAQYVGAKHASGDVLLFMDADVVQKPDCLSRAVHFLNSKNVDHLAVMPDVIAPGWVLQSVVVGFELFFNFFIRVWKIRDPKSSAHIGIGAFNMIRRQAYEKVGTHEAIRLRPDDDLKLGKLVKLNGFHQDFLFGTGSLSVEWYDSVGSLVKGLMKNSFSAVNYHVTLLVLGTVLQILLLIWPFAGCFLTTGPARVFNMLSSFILIFCCADNALRRRKNPFFALFLPFSLGLMVYIAWRAALQTLVSGGIEWRGTFYPLQKLKENKI